jgi:hypothetical protein
VEVGFKGAEEGEVAGKGVLFVALALSLASVLAVATPLAGEWSTIAQFDLDGGLSFGWLYSMLDIEYQAGTLTFSGTALVGGGQPLAGYYQPQWPDDASLYDLFFDAYGWVGPFAVASLLDLNPGTSGTGPAGFDLFTAAAWLDLGGVETFALFILDGGRELNAYLEGSGLNLGALGSIGQLLFAFDAGWNVRSTFLVQDAGRMWSFPYFLKDFYDAEGLAGYDYEPGEEFLWGSVLCDGMFVPGWGWQIEEDGCGAGLGHVYAALYYPFACFDVESILAFTGEKGFRSASFAVFDVDLGIPWLKLDAFQIVYRVDEKYCSVFDLDLVLADACLKPFFFLDTTDPWVLDGITLLGVTFEYTFGSATVKAGTIFDDQAAAFDRNGDRPLWADPEIGDARPDFCAMEEYDEYFALLVGGKSCCGGEMGFSIFNWFDAEDNEGEPAGVFGWQETIVNATVELSDDLAVSVGLSVLASGLQWLKVGTDVSW